MGIYFKRGKFLAGEKFSHLAINFVTTPLKLTGEKFSHFLKILVTFPRLYFPEGIIFILGHLTQLFDFGGEHAKLSRFSYNFYNSKDSVRAWLDLNDLSGKAKSVFFLKMIL